MTKCIAVWNNKELVGKNFQQEQANQLEKPEIANFD